MICQVSYATSTVPGDPFLSSSSFPLILLCFNSSNFTDFPALYHRMHGKDWSQNIDKELHGHDCHPIAGSNEAVLALIMAMITESILMEGGCFTSSRYLIPFEARRVGWVNAGG